MIPEPILYGMYYNGEYISYTGAIFYYSIIQLTILWFLHIVVIFWGVKFPFSSIKHKERGHLKYLHTCAVLLAIILPVVPVAVGFGTEGYTMPRFPPTICVIANSSAYFYSLIVPVGVILGLGNSLIATTFCLLYGMNRSTRNVSTISICFALLISILSTLSSRMVSINVLK